jgi:hypothetical protein
MQEFRRLIANRDAGALVNFVKSLGQPGFEQGTGFGEAVDAIFNGRAPDLALTAESDKDAVLLESLRAAFASMTFQREGLALTRGNDFLCPSSTKAIVGKFKPSPLEWLNVIVNALIAKTARSCVVTSIKNEGPWLIEWIAHYKAIGIDSIIVYYNDCDDGSDDLLRSLHDCGEIIAIANDVTPDVSPQLQAYAHAFSLLRIPHQHDWVAFIDSDEFLVAEEPLNDFGAMIEAVQQASHGGVDCIAVNWDWFASPEQFEWQNGLTVDRFRSAYKHEMKKCLFRPESALSIADIHFPLLAPKARAVDASGHEIAAVTTDARAVGEEIVRLNHYFARSFEEFILKKMRGRGALAAGKEARPLDAFLWASGGTSPRPFNAAIRARLAAEMQRLLSIPSVGKANEETERRARAKLTDIRANADIREVYNNLRRGLAPKQGDADINMNLRKAVTSTALAR